MVLPSFIESIRSPGKSIDYASRDSLDSYWSDSQSCKVNFDFGPFKRITHSLVNDFRPCIFLFWNFTGCIIMSPNPACMFFVWSEMYFHCRSTSMLEKQNVASLKYARKYLPEKEFHCVWLQKGERVPDFEHKVFLWYRNISCKYEIWCKKSAKR